jgi:hypothetical protein
MGLDVSVGGVVEASAAAGDVAAGASPVVAAGAGTTATTEAVTECVVMVVEVGVVEEAGAIKVEVISVGAAAGAAMSSIKEALLSALGAAGDGNPYLICIR